MVRGILDTQGVVIENKEDQNMAQKDQNRREFCQEEENQL